jgi:hypothetical protein
MIKLLMIVLCLQPICLIAQTQIDTIYSTPFVDGEITFLENENRKAVSIGNGSIAVGDGVSMTEGGIFLARGYVDFLLTNLPYSMHILEATIGLYQIGTFGNGKEGVYPQWDVPGGDTLFCMLDHIDYGESLDELDWSAGDSNDFQTLQSKIGILSKDTNVEYKTLDVTECVISDYNSGRYRSQFRIAFDIQKSDDRDRDVVGFESGNGTQAKWPYLIVRYQKRTRIENENYDNSSEFSLFQNFPNPFNIETVVSFTLPTDGSVRLELFNISGKKVKNLVNEHQAYGSYQIRISAGDLPSGVYLCRLRLTADDGKEFFKSKKMLLIK